MPKLLMDVSCQPLRYGTHKAMACCECSTDVVVAVSVHAIAILAVMNAASIFVHAFPVLVHALGGAAIEQVSCRIW